MAKKKKTEGPVPLFQLLRKIVLAGVGAMALATDEGEELINRLVERGQIAQEEGRKLVQEMRAKGQESFGASLDARIEKALDRLNVPTKKEVEELSKSIEALSKKIDALKKKA